MSFDQIKFTKVVFLHEYSKSLIEYQVVFIFLPYFLVKNLIVYENKCIPKSKGTQGVLV